MGGCIIYRQKLERCFSNLLNNGDTVLVHASLKAFGWFQEGPEMIIDALLATIGPTGNLVMPTATTSFSNTGFFDVRHTPSETGLLSEVFRQKRGVVRSCVPMASFAAYGHLAEEFTRPYNSYLDDTSPFSALLNLNGKVMLFGVDYNRCTLYHLSEERHHLPYNCYKVFEGTIVDHSGIIIKGGQRYFVRKDLTLEKNANPVGCKFQNQGIAKLQKLANSQIIVFSAIDFDFFCMRQVEIDNNVFLVGSNSRYDMA